MLLGTSDHDGCGADKPVSVEFFSVSLVASTHTTDNNSLSSGEARPSIMIFMSLGNLNSRISEVLAMRTRRQDMDH